jgi:hypothetical protein
MPGPNPQKACDESEGNQIYKGNERFIQYITEGKEYCCDECDQYEGSKILPEVGHKDELAIYGGHYTF